MVFQNNTNKKFFLEPKQHLLYGIQLDNPFLVLNGTFILKRK